MTDVTSDLVNPATADSAWLPWLAQLVSVTLRGDWTDTQKRQAIIDAAAGWRAGTKQSIANAAGLFLTGTRAVIVLDHTVYNEGDGTMWDICIVTQAEETPDFDAMVAGVERLGVAPAGCTIHARGFTATWDVIETSRPTWDDWDGSTWAEIEATT